MLKAISAALVAVSVLAVPALAGTPGKTAQASVNKITQAPVVKAEQGKAKLLNANARMGRHHKHYRHHRHPQAHRPAQAACEPHRGQARDISRKTQLNPIRQARVSPPLPRARLANDRPAHAPFALPMAVGWRALKFSRAKMRDNRVANSIPGPSGLRNGEGQGKSSLETFGQICGDDVAADRAVGLCCQR